jgi:hypothetical protein
LEFLKSMIPHMWVIGFSDVPYQFLTI